MFSRSFRAGLVATTLVTAGLGAGFAGTAYADPTDPASASDLVGVGSDTTQIVMKDLAIAYNASPPANKIASYDACVQSGTVCTAGGTITIRPAVSIPRPNGSGAGKGLLYGTSNNTNIDFARSSSGESTAETAAGLVSYPYAVDSLVTVVSNATATNAPTALSINQLLGIYNGTFTNWSQLGGSPGVIKPYLPQSGSGTLSFFTAQLQAANGGTAPTFAPSVLTSQEHDPTLIKNDPNAIAPFSKGRVDASIRVENGYIAQRAVYNVVRTGASATLTNLFNSAGFLCSTAAKPVIEADGFKQMALPANQGACGVATTTSSSNFTENNPDVLPATSTTSVSASPAVRGFGAASNAVITVGGAGATGIVTVFGRGFSGFASVSGGQAVIPLPANLPAGTYPINASYSGSTTFQGSAGTGSLTVTRTGSAVTSAFKATVKKKKRATGTVTVSAAGVAPTGSITITRNGKVVGSGALSGGTVTIKLAKLPKNTKKHKKHTLVITYSGDANVNASSTTIQIKQK